MRISVEEARANFDKLLEAIRHGEQVTIVENDRPVAEMKPATGPKAAADRLRELRKGVRLGMPGKDAIAQGRL